MKQEFMTAARKIGRYLGVVALSFSLLACGGEADAASNNSTSTPTAQTAQERVLPFPSFPASFETSVYQGQQGCIPDDNRYEFAVMKNEGMSDFGVHPKLNIPGKGVFVMPLFYNAAKDYGYLMSQKGDGKVCVAEKITGLKTHEQLNLMNVSHAAALTPEDCTFAPQVVNLCGTFERISARLINAGYSQDWQAKDSSGNTMTMFSGTGQSWITTTHAKTGATIFTAAGQGEFVKYEESPQQQPNQPSLVAKN